jgi:predicted dehydrogenase
MDHVRALANPLARLNPVALCDQDSSRLANAAAQVPGATTYADARAMLEAHRPDVFSFVTQPTLRLPLVRLAVEYGVKIISLEKPMALSVTEARELCAAASESGVRLVVCHQHKYGGHWQAVKSLIDRGELGEIQTIHATSRGWLAYYATHLIDYAMWLNGGHEATWAVGHVHGFLEDNGQHPSPDYFMGQAEFANGVRVILECGPLAPDLPPYKNPGLRSGEFWMDAGATVVGTEGTARIVAGKGWSAVTRNSGYIGSEEHRFDGTADTIPYFREIAEWLDDPTRLHSCRAEIALHGFETVAAMCASALERRRVELPLATGYDVFERLPDVLST